MKSSEKKNLKSKKNKSKYSFNSRIDSKKKIVPKKTPKWFYLIIVLIPIIFVLLLEVTLRIFNYGTDLSQWVDIGNDKLVINPNIGKRYFNTTNFLPQTSDDSFDKQKSSNSFRVFVLGGSSAAGFPYMPMGSFSRYIKRRLELVYPKTKIEVVNIAMTAVNSYTILDLLPGVLNQKPNLILLYAGHNEYYGALGVGSLETFGQSRFIIKTILYLNKFKTTQLLKNFINWIFSSFSSDSNIEQSGTLMSKLAQKKSIELNSKIFDKGVEQYFKNLDEILTSVKDKNVPIIIGKLVSNYKDQKPFISKKTTSFKSAGEVYKEAQIELEELNNLQADSLFKLAKDLDELRFRAPEAINKVVEKLANDFNVPVVQIDSIFNSASPNGITGNNLMVDHLHPNVEGYNLMGDAFFKVMNKYHYLPNNEPPKISISKQDSVTRKNFVFTKLDSAIGNSVVALLKNDWPFLKRKSKLSHFSILKPKNFIDSISFKYVENKLSYVDAYVEAASISLRRDRIEDYIAYMNEIIYKYPGLKNIKTALKFFYDQGKINPKDYTSKRSGIIAIFTKDFDNAIKFLQESYNSNSVDEEILYYLSLAYTEKKEYEVALSYLNKCLKINPIYQKALLLKQRIIDKK